MTTSMQKIAKFLGQGCQTFLFAAPNGQL